MDENLTVKDADLIPFVAVAPDEICRINADGTTTYHWDRIEAAAQRWTPGCADIAVCLAKLLLPLRRLHALNGELLEALKRHGAHDGNCDYMILLTSLPPMRKPCSCGLHAAIAKAEGKT